MWFVVVSCAGDALMLGQINKGDYPVARLLTVFERFIALQALVCRTLDSGVGLEAYFAQVIQGLLDNIGDMRSGVPDLTLLCKLYRGYEDFLSLYLRYPALVDKFFEVTGPMV